MPARLSAFVIWALVAASAVFWGLRLVVRAPGAPAHTVAATDTAPLRADLTRLFGAPTVAAAPATQTPAMASRFQLTGVVAPKAPGGPGVALIAVDGKMPRAFRVGSAIDGDLVLQSVSHRSAAIGPASGKPAVVLEMPPLPVAASGTLPPAPQMLPPGVGMPPPGGVPVPSSAMPAPVPSGGLQPLTPVVPGGAASMPGRLPSPEFPRQNELRRGTVSQ